MLRGITGRMHFRLLWSTVGTAAGELGTIPQQDLENVNIKDPCATLLLLAVVFLQQVGYWVL